MQKKYQVKDQRYLNLLMLTCVIIKEYVYAYIIFIVSIHFLSKIISGAATVGGGQLTPCPLPSPGKLSQTCVPIFQSASLQKEH